MQLKFFLLQNFRKVNMSEGKCSSPCACVCDLCLNKIRATLPLAVKMENLGFSFPTEGSEIAIHGFGPVYHVLITLCLLPILTLLLSL